jgi:hypothetical protein
MPFARAGLIRKLSADISEMKMELSVGHLNRISFRRVIWLFPLAVMIHEAEEWDKGGCLDKIERRDLTGVKE